MPESPFSRLSALNAQADVRRERRVLSTDEFARLIAATGASDKTIHGLTGPDRAMVYLTSAYSGLRAKELATLTLGAIKLDGDPPVIVVKAAYSKHRREDIQPIRPDLAERLRAWLNQRVTLRIDARLWPGKWYKAGATLVRADLAVAGIDYVDESGLVFDFHALRHQYITSLAAAGVHPKQAQTLARHSSITLTMDHYTHLSVADVAGALAGLPDLPGLESEAAQATGTDARDAMPANPQPPDSGRKQTGPAAEFVCAIGCGESPRECPPVSAVGHLRLAGEGPENTKNPGKNQGFEGEKPNEADGTRTRNVRIDSQNVTYARRGAA
jgi:hypothetical protein